MWTTCHSLVSLRHSLVTLWIGPPLGVLWPMLLRSLASFFLSLDRPAGGA